MAVDDNTVVYVVIALVLLALVIFGVLIAQRRQRARSLELRRLFGPEYDLALEKAGHRGPAERALLARARRVQHFRFQELSPGDRRRFEATWARIQAQFVDDPGLAVGSANHLIGEVMRARGYPSDDFQQRVEDLSVNYPMVVQHYRSAESLSTSAREGRASTEDLRQAVVHYRVLFEELLQESTRHQAALRNAPA